MQTNCFHLISNDFVSPAIINCSFVSISVGDYCFWSVLWLICFQVCGRLCVIWQPSNVLALCPSSSLSVHLSLSPALTFSLCKAAISCKPGSEGCRGMLTFLYFAAEQEKINKPENLLKAMYFCQPFSLFVWLSCSPFLSLSEIKPI